MKIQQPDENKPGKQYRHPTAAVQHKDSPYYIPVTVHVTIRGGTKGDPPELGSPSKETKALFTNEKRARTTSAEEL